MYGNYLCSIWLVSESNVKVTVPGYNHAQNGAIYLSNSLQIEWRLLWNSVFIYYHSHTSKLQCIFYRFVASPLTSHIKYTPMTAKRYPIVFLFVLRRKPWLQIKYEESRKIIKFIILFEIPRVFGMTYALLQRPKYM